jgi:alpha-glucuronidase
MASGNSLWEELCLHYDQGVKTARWMQSTWDALEGELDQERFGAVQMLLAMQAQEAAWWRNACLLYFQEFSQRPFPDAIEQPGGSLEHYKRLNFPYAPGIKPTW